MNRFTVSPESTVYEDADLAELRAEETREDAELMDWEV